MMVGYGDRCASATTAVGTSSALVARMRPFAAFSALTCAFLAKLGASAKPGAIGTVEVGTDQPGLVLQLRWPEGEWRDVCMCEDTPDRCGPSATARNVALGVMAAGAATLVTGIWFLANRHTKVQVDGPALRLGSLATLGPEGVRFLGPTLRPLLRRFRPRPIRPALRLRR